MATLGKWTSYQTMYKHFSSEIVHPTNWEEVGPNITKNDDKSGETVGENSLVFEWKGIENAKDNYIAYVWCEQWPPNIVTSPWWAYHRGYYIPVNGSWDDKSNTVKHTVTSDEWEMLNMKHSTFCTFAIAGTTPDFPQNDWPNLDFLKNQTFKLPIE